MAGQKALRSKSRLITRFYATRGPIGLVVVLPDIRRTRVAVLVLDRLLGAVYESNLDQACSHLSDASRRALNVLNERRYRARSDHGEARRRVLETSRRELTRRSDDKKAAKAEKKAQKKEKQKADLADSAQFKGFDKVVVAELVR